MKKITGLILICHCTFFSMAQKRCDLSLMDKSSKDELSIFWTNLQEASQKRDSNKIKSLCDFPFYLANRIVTNDPSDEYQNFKLDSNNIIRYADLIFYDDDLKTALALCTDASECLIFHGDFKTKHKTCSYVFCYMCKNKAGINQERCLSITKIDGAHKIASFWIRQ